MIESILNIEESNRKIVEFMNVKCKFVDIRHLNQQPFYMIEFNDRPKGYYDPSPHLTEERCLNAFVKNAQYHSDWNWLMMVVEKIESLFSPHHGYFGVHISSNGCNIQGTNLHWAIENLSEYGWVYTSDPNAILDTKLESTYYNIVKFIEWYTTEYKGE